MTNLNNALTSLQTSFSTTWSNRLTSQINPSLTVVDNYNQIETELAIILGPALANLFDDFNKSIIEGEYALDTIVAKLILDNLDAHINTSANFVIPSTVDYTSFSQAIFSENFLIPARSAIKNYKRLIESLEIQLNYEPKVDILFHLHEDEVLETNSTAEWKLFDMNLQIASIDHSLKFDNSTFEKLISYGHKLSSIAGAGSISDILKKKCDYLISKLTHRFDSKKTTKYAFDFQFHSLTAQNPPELAYFDNIISGHYDNSSTNEFRNRYNIALSVFDTAPQNLSLDDYHALLKYFKDIEPDLKNIKALRNFFINLYSANINRVNRFNKKAFEVAYCYLENNILSLELEKKQFTINNWKDNFLVYTQKALALKNSNFFPYFKIIDGYLKVEIVDQFKSESINLDVIDDLIIAYEDNLKNLSENLSICQNTNYLTYQLDHSSCLVQIPDIHGTNWNCFIASSFVVPLDYSYWRKTADILTSELVKFKAMRDLRISIKEDIKQIYKVKDKLAESDKRHIEILSIFSAIVLFVSNEVQLFSNLKSITDAVLFTLFFAYALGLFVLLIWFVTRPAAVKLKELPLTHYVLMGIFILGFVGSATFIYFNPAAKAQLSLPKMNPYEKRIDSLKGQVQIDSLNYLRRKYSN